MLSILIVDDSEDDVYIAERAIKKSELNAQVYSKSDGEEAFELFNNHEESKDKYGDKFPPTAILLDINMPLMNGFEFLEAFQKLRSENPEYYDTVFIVMLTSSPREEDVNRALCFDFVKGYLTKPMNAEDIVSIVESFVPAEQISA